MVESSLIHRLHKFLWAQYGSKGLDLCTVDFRLWMSRILDIDPFEEKSSNTIRQRLVDARARADVDGEYSSWSVKLSSSDFSEIKSSDYFTFNKALFSD